MAGSKDDPVAKLQGMITETVKTLLDERDQRAAEEKDPEARALRKIRGIIEEVVDSRLGDLLDEDEDGKPKGQRRRARRQADDDDDEGEERPKLGILGL